MKKMKSRLIPEVFRMKMLLCLSCYTSDFDRIQWNWNFLIKRYIFENDVTNFIRTTFWKKVCERKVDAFFLSLLKVITSKLYQKILKWLAVQIFLKWLQRQLFIFYRLNVTYCLKQDLMIFWIQKLNRLCKESM